jgi:hypothetical protein
VKSLALYKEFMLPDDKYAANVDKYFTRAMK